MFRSIWEKEWSVSWRTACGSNHTKLHLHEVPNGLVDLEMGADVRCTCCTVKPSNQYATHRSGLVTGLSRWPEGRGMAEEDRDMNSTHFIHRHRSSCANN